MINPIPIPDLKPEPLIPLFDDNDNEPERPIDEYEEEEEEEYG